MKIALVGYGKMGKEIEKIARQRGHEISVIIDIDNMSALNTLSKNQADVAIEFTTPHSAYDNVRKCLIAGVPVVSGSTGWGENLKDAGNIAIQNKTSFLWASNFSIGVNIFFRLNNYLAKIMDGIDTYEPTMTEIHHIQKKDAPSGTAITLAEGILSQYHKMDQWMLKPKNGKRVSKKDKKNLMIQAIRKGQVPGTHKVKYKSKIDYIELIHCAKGRQGFALGAVVAAEFIHDKTGVFSMDDVLQF